MTGVVQFRSRHPLVGIWRHPDQEYGTSLRIAISAADEGFRVRAWDDADGEELGISSVSWDGRALSFEAHVPSTGWRTLYEVEPSNEGTVTVRFTQSESWVRGDEAP